MAGFSKEDVYFVPRATLHYENKSWSSLTKLLLPDIDLWRRQADSANGDKSACAITFLYELLPWFVEVLVQDGIYFIHDFPSHPLTRFLKVSHPLICFLKVSPARYNQFTFSLMLQFYLFVRKSFPRHTNAGQQPVGRSAKNW